MDLGLRGKKALVTGGSRGIGKEVALILAAEGADLALCARNEGPLKAFADELVAEHGVNVFPRALDVADGDALKTWIEDVGRELGGLDIYINNASASVPQLPPEDAWKASFDADIMAFVRGLAASTQLLAESDAASVVSIGTTASLEAFAAGPNSFVAAKAAVIQHTLNQAAALAPQGIRLNVVSPGPVWVEEGVWNTIKDHMTAFYESTVAQVPLGSRLTNADEVARAVVFLASPAASHITGTNLVVDGGFTKRFAW